MIPATAFVLLASQLAALVRPAEAKDEDKWESPVYTDIFKNPLPIPPVAVPLTTYTNTTTNTAIDYYELEIKPFTAQTYPASQGFKATTYVGYNGIAPGPTFHINQGRETVVRFINKSNSSSAIHLHGSYSRPMWDGWANDLVPPNYYKDYYYPNRQSARTLWYHDHAFEITAVNAYFGQAGFYILQNPAESKLGLPQGQYDVPLMINSRFHKSNGQLVSPAGETTALYGDVISVNGQPWPHMIVEPRKYRFRLLNSAVSRTFKTYLVASGVSARQTMTVIASDAGLVSTATDTLNVVIGIAERWDIVIDFSKYTGKNVTLMNERDFFTNEDYAATDRIIQFRVGKTVTSTSNNNLPKALTTLDLPPSWASVDRSFVFERKNGEWRINGVGFADVKNRVLAHPRRGDTEQWELINKSGGWTHPIHVHLVDFQIISRTGGRGAVEPYERVALKDVVYLGTNERVKVRARYEPWDGQYMFHCHNLIHEDHDMLAAFNTTDLVKDFDYPDANHLNDPMDPRFQAKPGVGPFNANTVKTTDLPALSATGAYANIPQTIAALRKYWATHS
ncbi:bilirubin oxidase precursor [Auriculariales sp. MPI-PUGE-AT-0066]|nr:bilirubin oxidase precursor [Auriculariales sp. MPI-PUGE-AT-0066]